MKGQLTVILFALAVFAKAQIPNFIKGNSEAQVRYEPTAVIDSTFGIAVYNELCPALGGDSVRYVKKGYQANDWIEDFYTNEKILHKGLYQMGRLKAFQNFYPNGTMERSFKMKDMKRGELIQYYDDGKVRSEVYYYNSTVQKQTDYYKNGSISFAEESDKKAEMLIKRNTYRENGQPFIVFELTDKKKKLYYHKQFNKEGSLWHEGPMVFYSGDYVKEGEWKYYDKQGKVTKTIKYHNGDEVN